MTKKKLEEMVKTLMKIQVEHARTLGYLTGRFDGHLIVDHKYSAKVLNKIKEGAE